MELPQRECAEVPGLGIDTSRNREQGLNRPDPSAFSLVMAFDKAREAAFVPVA